MLFHACLNEDLALQGMEVIHRINKDERDESLAPYSFLKRCCQSNFSEIFKGGRLSSSQAGIHNIPSMFVMLTENITRYNLNTDIFRTLYNI